MTTTTAATELDDRQAPFQPGQQDYSALRAATPTTGDQTPGQAALADLEKITAELEAMDTPQRPARHYRAAFAQQQAADPITAIAAEIEAEDEQGICL